MLVSANTNPTEPELAYTLFKKRRKKKRKRKQWQTTSSTTTETGIPGLARLKTQEEKVKRFFLSSANLSLGDGDAFFVFHFQMFFIVLLLLPLEQTLSPNFQIHIIYVQLDRPTTLHSTPECVGMSIGWVQIQRWQTHK